MNHKYEWEGGGAWLGVYGILGLILGYWNMVGCFWAPDTPWESLELFAARFLSNLAVCLFF
jgi:hypothetical protein